MRAKALWLIGLLTAGMMLQPLTGVYGQDVPPEDPITPFPLYHDRPETGGLYTTASYVMYRQTNPLEHQPIASRGFFDVDGTFSGKVLSVKGTNGLLAPFAYVPNIGGRVGSFTPVLFADQAGGPSTYQPGFRVGIGWRFGDGVSVELSWMNLMKAQYSHVVTLTNAGFKTGPNQADSYLSSPVVNYPPEYGGPQIDGPALALVTPAQADLGIVHTLSSGYGIWNAADVMSIEFDQRFSQIDLIGRVPIFETDCDRCYGLVGFRFAWIWERFKWRTVDQGFQSTADLSPNSVIDPFTGQVFIPNDPVVTVHNPVSTVVTSGAGNVVVVTNTPDPTIGLTRHVVPTQVVPDQSPLNAAVYTNIVSNRMYGPAIGLGNEWYLGHGFAISADVMAVPFLDIVKERAKYELGDKDQAPQSKRSISTYRMAGELQGSLKVWWYPIEGVQVQFGYDVMGFFNTIASPEPVSFDYGGLDPAWREKFRFFDGLEFGVGFIF